MDFPFVDTLLRHHYLYARRAEDEKKNNGH